MSFTYYHCEKGIYYFTEFISQIENENSFLKLSSIDAIIFVYKKTIYNINKKMMDTSSRSELSHVDTVIKFLININKSVNYEELQPYFVAFLGIKDKLKDMEIRLEECGTLKQIQETLKKEICI